MRLINGDLTRKHSSTVFNRKRKMDQGRGGNKSTSFSYYRAKQGLQLFQVARKITLPFSENIQIAAGNYLFVFNLGKRISISSSGKDSRYLSEYQGLCLQCKKEAMLEIRATNGEFLRLCIFVMDTNVLKTTFPGLLDFENHEVPIKNFIFHKNDLSLAIVDELNILMKAEKEFPNNLLILGRMQIILGLWFKDFVKSKSEEFGSKSQLRKWEIEELVKVTERIRENPENNYLVSELAHQCGIGILKMQMGFKEMHGTTVANFIRDVRLKKSAELIGNTNMNISEVVYSVGFCSRSYFSRIFRLKYKCTPTEYQQKKYSSAKTA